jgi:serine/threonine protein kinase
MDHPNIVQLVDSIAEAKEEKIDDPVAHTFEEKSKDAEYVIALEHAGGRDLIQCLMHTGNFDEKTGRFYFKQLMEGIAYIHEKGMVHRDLKPDNLLFNDEFRMKVADFGTVGSLHKQAVLSTFCGTENYMAPEVLASYEERQQYAGEPVDVFSCGVILFIMVVGSMPFQIALPDNDLYKYIHQGRWKHFWRKYQSMQGGLDDIPQSFLKLIEGMLANNVQDRMTVRDVMQSEWFNGEVPSEGDVHESMMTRKREVEARIKAEKQAKKEERAANKKKTYSRGVGDDEEEAFELDEDQVELMKELKTHDQRIRNLGIDTLLYTKKHPMQLEEEFSALSEEWPVFEFDQKKPFRYNMHIQIDRPAVNTEVASDDEESKGQDPSTEEVRVGLRCDVTAMEDNKFCMEFTRLAGEGEEANKITSIDFYKAFGSLTEIFESIADEDE